MASMTTQELLAAALELPEEKRAELARNLLASLDTDVSDLGDMSSEEWTAAWSDEIRRRVVEIRSGQAVLVDGDDALQQVRERLRPDAK
jgi:hypothetical protein